jgi:dihydroxyacetone kinase-like predicted kinase
MLAAAVQLLSQRAETINALNVFPVPDGDTGTNMLLTMRAAVRAADDVNSDDIGGISEALARGALMGARGNSGVILSQYLRGLARGLAGRARIDGGVLAQALENASMTAWKAVTNPVDGTFLSVAREIAVAAAAEARRTDDLSSVMCRAVDEGRIHTLRLLH